MTTTQYAIARTAAQLQKAKLERDLTPDETRALAVCSKLTAQYASTQPVLEIVSWPAFPNAKKQSAPAPNSPPSTP